MKILFVCTGNTCRGPIAAALYHKASEKAGRHDEVISRGTMGGLEMSKVIGDHCLSSIVMRQHYDIDVGAHLPKSISGDDIVWADLILTMTKHHVTELRQTFQNRPELHLDAKLHTFGNYLGLQVSNIEDPFGKSFEVYLQEAKQLESWTKLLAEKLNSKEAKLN